MTVPENYIELSERELCRQDLLAYCVAVMPNFAFPKHIILIATYLERVARGEIKKLMIFAPPRHGKSELTSKLFPSWYIGYKQGRHTVALATYGQDLSNEIGISLQNRMNSDVYREIFPEAIPSDSANSIKRLVTINGGGYICTAVGGALTGKGGHLRVLDDPNKNREEADSDLEQKKQWDWWTSVFMTRGEVDIKPDGTSCDDDSPIVVILTRWSDKDIARRLIDLEKEQIEAGIDIEPWTILNLEAVCESDNDPLGRPKVEDISNPKTWKDENVLWPEKYNARALGKLFYAVGPRDFNSLFQQHPSNSEGELFKRHLWGFYDVVPPECDRPVMSWDCNYKETDGSDFAVGLIARVRRKTSVYLMDRRKGRWPFPLLCEEVRKAHRDYPDHTAIYIEEKANGRPVIDTLAKEIPGIIAVEPKILGSKDSRHQAAAKYQNSGCIYLPLSAVWREDFIECMAPIGANPKYDDDGDAFAQLVLMELGQPSVDGMLRHLERMLAEAGVDVENMEFDSNDPYDAVYGKLGADADGTETWDTN
jgi:predicted phage terminase large subunit-like protein